ncbi:S9 family peptidase [Sphingomonas sp. CGMCC 1.13654]|uniref:S9 family peptidase n=1 Tax=Sphingomonas chungangi TaxID=2683589 RepID=A0A838L3D2_9SPHN|nr:prolyl oligopeptidase family serine peptidase [Sphingomonas chungangi]MBA2933175.1 S9 family peptidase [Sphingomonas chungangi]MVW57847.1 prolyl oligopeptidase family serine peptidase [Sphingomonas chungangi]
MTARAMRFFGAVLLAGVAMPALAKPTLPDFLGYSFVSELTSAEHADRITWVENVKGVRNVWAASGPDFAAHPVTHYTADDGQEITQLRFDRAADTIVFVRGGDHDANWPAEGDLAPDPANGATEDKVEVYAVPFAGGTPRLLSEGDEPAVSAKGMVAFVKEHQIWSVPLDGSVKPAKLLFDRGKDRQPLWSPDGSRLAFVSGRGDHSFVTLFTDAATPLIYLAPSTGRDGDPVWSPDGTRIAFSRQPGDGGAPVPFLVNTPQPFAIWTADVATGEGRCVWASPVTLNGSYPQDGDGLGLRWMAGDTLAFLTTLDGWEHLYALPAAGGTPKLLTPGNYMVEHVSLGRDKRTLLYAANTGSTKDDDDRRHVFAVTPENKPVALIGGTGLQWSPVAAGRGVALISADATHPAAVAFAQGKMLKPLHVAVPDYPVASLVTPKLVSWTAPDGLTIQGQLFGAAGTAKKRPAVIFVHGGPSRQMLLGWHYMGYYSNGYAVNQYLASRGFVVLSVNYRLGIGYGRAFEQPDHGGAAGGAEYQDVLSGARWLQQQPGVDPARIGIWGGSYGGYLTGMALSRNSDVFKAGADLHGVHDWSRLVSEENPPAKRYEQGDWDRFLKTAFESSPDAQIADWRSPVLLIQGDDDRNVRFNQTVDLAGRLTKAGVPFEELVIPNEIHGFLRYESWLKADAATARFLEEKLGPVG